MSDHFKVSGFDRFMPNNFSRIARENRVSVVEQSEKSASGSLQTDKLSAKTPGNRDRIEIRKPMESESFVSDLHERVRKDVVQKMQASSDSTRLTSIRQQIESGSYMVDPTSIARKLLEGVL